MLPVSVLPVAGILLGVGSANFSWLPQIVSQIMAQSGDAIFANLPLLFAIGVAIGLTENDGVAALAGTIGYVVFLAAMGVCAKLRGIETSTIMGIPVDRDRRLRRHHRRPDRGLGFQPILQDPAPALSRFFRGQTLGADHHRFCRHRRGAILSFIWPPIGGGDRSLLALGGARAAGAGFHHLRRRRALADSVRPPPRLECAVLLPGGRIRRSRAPARRVHGEIARFIAGDPTAGNMTGGYLFKMWGLPAAALAMWRAARPENRAKVGGIMISAALTAFLTGITEPIEFAFLFVAPMLYAIHALLAGVAYLLCIVLGIKHGFTFSHGLIDYVVLFPKSTQCALALRPRADLGGLYYVVFSFFIRKFNLMTPGREEIDEVAAAAHTASGDALCAADSSARFGGRSNIVEPRCLHHAPAREAQRCSKVNADKLKALGAAGVVMVGDGVQAIFGTRSEKSENRDRRIPEDRRSRGRRSGTALPGEGAAAGRHPAEASRSTRRRQGERPHQGARRQGKYPARGCLCRNAFADRHDNGALDEAALRAAGVEAVVKLPDHVIHLLTGLNADQYAAEMRGQLAKN